MQWRCALIVAALVVGVAATDSGDWEDEDGDGAGRRVAAPYDVDGEVRHDWSQGNLRTWDGAVGTKRPLCATAAAQSAGALGHVCVWCSVLNGR
jgi:hypothetical protein